MKIKKSLKSTIFRDRRFIEKGLGLRPFLRWANYLTTSVLILASDQIHSAKGEPEYETPQEQAIEPWFTGTLLASSGNVVPIGYANIEPYLIAADTFGQYNRNWKSESIPRFWGINPLVFIQVGLTEKIDFLIQPQFSWNETQGHSATRFGDLPVGFDIQLLTNTKTDWWPAIKLVLRENLPTGKYQKLNPHKLGTDATGTGSFITAVGLVFARLFELNNLHYLNTRLCFSYDMPARVHVKGFNTYGGGYDTKGYVYPGNGLITVLGIEYTLTRNWVLALDVMNTYTSKTRFTGFKGRDFGLGTGGNPFDNFQSDSDGLGEASVGASASNSLSLAPAIEYNFNESVGIIGGCWFTVAGRNAAQFVSGVLAINFYIQLKKPK